MKDGRLAYDYLVLATGARHAYFGHEEWEPVAPGLKSLEDALEIRRRILLAFERAERETDPEARRAPRSPSWSSAADRPASSSPARSPRSPAKCMKSDFRAIDPTETRVVLVEAGPRVLASFPESLSAHAAEALTRSGVERANGTRA